jgi:hypothetical protein
LQGAFAAVAGYLLDLAEPAGDEWFDSIQLSRVGLAYVFRTCEIDSSLVRGADEVRYCIDRQIDASMRAIFGSSSGSITALAQIPAGWSESVRLSARSLGLHDLRKQ